MSFPSLTKGASVWLMKSEPDVFSFDDLRNAPNQTTLWEGVRNYQARNFMRDSMRKGDHVLFYHSNCTPPSIVGLATIASQAAYPDPSQFDSSSEYFDPKASHQNPRWLVVDVQFLAPFINPISLSTIKDHPLLSNMMVAQRGMRLSIHPVELSHYAQILAIA